MVVVLSESSSVICELFPKFPYLSGIPAPRSACILVFTLKSGLHYTLIKTPFTRATYTEIRPFSLPSRLLAPTVTPISPPGFLHPCFSTSQIDKSYRDNVIVTVCFSPGCSSTFANPRSTDGGSPDDAGKLT